jgi:hypothetical protein
MRNGLLILASCLILALVGCGGEGPRPISVSGGTIQIGDVTCEPAHNLIRRLERCGLSPEERQRALKLMLAEKKRRLAEAKKKLSRLPSKTDVLWAARTMYVESTQSVYEMSLIGTVIRNRMRSEKWPNRVRPVVKDRWQFTGIHREERGVMELSLKQYHTGEGLTLRQHRKWRRAVRASFGVLSWPDSLLPLEATHYVNLDEVERPSWAHRRPDYKTDAHSYYSLN